MARLIASLIMLTLVVLWLLVIGGLVRFVITTDQRGHPPAAVLAYPLIAVGVVGLVVLALVWLILVLVLRKRRSKPGPLRGSVALDGEGCVHQDAARCPPQ